MPWRVLAYSRLRLLGVHATCDSTAGLLLTRMASPPSLAEVAKTSPWAVKATFLPSGETTRSQNWVVSFWCSTAKPAAAPRSRMATGAACLPAMSYVQI